MKIRINRSKILLANVNVNQDPVNVSFFIQDV